MCPFGHFGPVVSGPTPSRERDETVIQIRGTHFGRIYLQLLFCVTLCYSKLAHLLVGLGKKKKNDQAKIVKRIDLTSTPLAY